VTATVATPPAPQPFTLRLVLGLFGIWIAALSSGLNDRVTDIALPDIQGIFGLDSTQGSWLIGAYQAAEVATMMIAPWFATTFSIRRFAIFVVASFALLALLMPFATSPAWFITLRVLQGIMGGALPPLLMTVALRFLPPSIKLYGLGAYALTATFGPNIATGLAVLWTDSYGWPLLFWQVIPMALLAAGLIAYGLPQDPLRLERFRQIDLFGMISGCGGMAMLVLALQQGERLDWLNSPLICALLFGAATLWVVFLINEWYHPLPLFKLQLLQRRNLSFALLALAGVLTVALSGSALPAAYFAQVQGFRPQEFAPLALIIGLPQLLLAPLVAALCNNRWIDSRWVLCTGFALLACSCFLGSSITTDWARQNFYLIQLLQAFGQPMVVVPILLLSTSVILPPEGPFASAMFNTVRGFSSIAAGTLVEHIVSERSQLHSNRLLDHAGTASTFLSQPGDSASLAPLLDNGSISSLANLAQFSAQVARQSAVLGISDSYLLMLAAAILFIVLTAWMPMRTYPPQALTPPPLPPQRMP